METIKNDSISREEEEAINKFFDSYEGKNTIVADSYDEQYHVRQFEGVNLVFKPFDYSWKNVRFKRRIVSGKQEYVVYLNLIRDNIKSNDPKCMTVRQINISSPSNYHMLTIPSSNPTIEKFVYRAIDIFDEKKTISPAQAYFNRIYNVNRIPELIGNHEWGTIARLIEDIPMLANQLFIMDNPFITETEQKIYFGTIIYQLISYRTKTEGVISDIDLLEIDKLIYKLRKSELIRLKINNALSTSWVWPTHDMIDPSKIREGYRLSEVKTVDNGEMIDEQQTLKRVIKTFEN